MNFRMKLGLVLGCGVALCTARRANAQTELPVIVAYEAPAVCANASAFKELVAAEVAHNPNPARPWRFTVSIRHDAEFVGTLTTEGGTREIRASTCDEVTASLATIIALAEPELPVAHATPMPAIEVVPPPPLSLPPEPALEVGFLRGQAHVEPCALRDGD